MSSKEYYLANKDQINRNCRAYKLAHRDEITASSKAYRAAHQGQNTAWHHRTGRSRPISEAKDCPAYLGVYVAERALSRFFDNIRRMPINNPGFDFLCGRGYKIDVKSACLQEQTGKSDRWQFTIKRNTTADYFLCLAFDNRESLVPQYMWLIPGEIVNHYMGLVISDTEKSRARYSKYEQPLDRVNACCSEMRAGAVVVGGAR